MQMRRSWIVLALAMAVAGGAHAQRLKIDEGDRLRELNLSPVLKTRLGTARSRIAQKNLAFQVVYHPVLDKKIEDIAGGLRLTDSQTVAAQNQRIAPLLQQDRLALIDAIKKDPGLRQKMPILKFSPAPSLKKWDWRVAGEVSGIRSQKWGTCWTYAAVASLESSYLLRNDLSLDGSEQYLAYNSGGMSAKADEKPGGWCYKAVDYLVKAGTVTDAACPDTGTYGVSAPVAKPPYGGVAWGFCHGANGMASVAEIKSALCEHGPVTTWIDAGGTFGAYGKGVYDDDDDKDPGHKVGGHFVTIVGWDDVRGAWLIKNSWGADWGSSCGPDDDKRGDPGKRGYMWIKYGCHGVGSDSTWIRARSRFYRISLNPAILKTPIKDIKSPILR